MQLNHRNKTQISAFVLAVVGSTVAAIQLLNIQKPAMAGESIRQCMRELIGDGISETNAAIACRGQRGSNRGNYRNRQRYLELQARSGPTPEGRWRYSAPGVPYDAMLRAGCQNISGDDWRCPTPKLRVYVQNHRATFIQLPQLPELPPLAPF
jgi:hypothetical protein